MKVQVRYVDEDHGKVRTQTFEGPDCFLDAAKFIASFLSPVEALDVFSGQSKK